MGMTRGPRRPAGNNSNSKTRSGRRSGCWEIIRRRDVVSSPRISISLDRQMGWDEGTETVQKGRGVELGTFAGGMRQKSFSWEETDGAEGADAVDAVQTSSNSIWIFTVHALPW
jgi:hypothetical protein